MYDNDKVLAFVKTQGPVLPVQVSKEMGTNILMASAMLSELSSKKQVKVSSIKVGGSPLYYTPGQETKLQDYADKLPDKEAEAYNLLREIKILKDSELQPAHRIALRELGDFAKPLEVHHNHEKHLFWKWFLAATEELEPTIKKKLGVDKPAKPVKPSVSKPPSKPVQRTIKSEKKELPQGAFLDELSTFFQQSHIDIIETDIKRKASEVNFIVDVGSAVGKLRYFCKAKSKKSITDGDLSSAFMESQAKNLPCLFLTKGKLTKKAEDMLTKLKGISVKTI